jgi:hypothetical protein
MPKNVERYVNSDRKAIDGWLSALDAWIIAELLAKQSELCIAGSVGEIGIHHGKLLLLLHLSTTDPERTFAVDLFEFQNENVDNSGSGSKAKFIRNVHQTGGRLEAIDIFETNSLRISWDEIKASVGQSCRFFSVDGGHTCELTLNDLKIASKSLCEGGIICLDDYFNEEFADVSVGLNRFMQETSDCRLVPISISDNKVMLCDADHKQIYQDAIREVIPGSYFVKDTEFFESVTPVFRTPAGMYDRIKQSKLAKALRSHPVGIALKPFVRKLLHKY